MPAGSLKTRNQQLLGECGYHSIQTAINSIKTRNTSIYVLPGVYDEHQWATAARSDYCSHLKTSSTSPLAASEYIGSITSPETSAANAESNPALLWNGDDLVVHAVFVDEGPTLKRWRARARGRTSRIMKRTCHITVQVAQREDS